MNERIFPKNDDVFWSEKSSPSESRTLTIRQLRGVITAKTKMADNWFHSGIDCKFLSESGGGWVKGKMRLVLEFIPYEGKPMQGQKQSSSAPESPLDDLREQLDS